MWGATGSVGQRIYRLLGADCEDVGHGVSVLALSVQALPQRHATGRGKNRGDRQYSERPWSGQGELERQRYQPDRHCGAKVAAKQAGKLQGALA
jgi:hypothetical protein